MTEPEDDDLRRILREFRESTAAAFAAQDARFDAHDARFDEHDRRFDEHDRRFDALESRMANLEGRMTDLQGSVRNLADELRQRMLTMETAILNSIRDFAVSVDARLTRVEQRLDGAA